MISCTRRFGVSLTRLEDIHLATASYAARVGEKLGWEKICCKTMNIFVMTNEFRKQDQQYSKGIDLQLPVANVESTFLPLALSCVLFQFFKKGRLTPIYLFK